MCQRIIHDIVTPRKLNVKKLQDSRLQQPQHADRNRTRDREREPEPEVHISNDGYYVLRYVTFLSPPPGLCWT